ncbi:MAG: hypothetical protein FJ191_10515 [Gammaproteobacteria bacterium]|nr:hypothetical protein [Gammaproteobacteria bacterium]
MGYHSPAGRAGNPLAHTPTSRLFAQVALNGETASEFLIHAWAGLWFGCRCCSWPATRRCATRPGPAANR